MNFLYPASDVCPRIYKNIAKQSEQWRLFDPSIPAFSACPIDSDGYPTAIPAGSYAIAQVEAPTYARTGSNVYTGAHRITWDGTGTLGVVNSFVGTQIPLENGDTFTNAEGLIYLLMYTTDPTDPVRNVEIYETQYVDDHDDLFYPEYYAAIEGLTTYRFNNWHLDTVYDGETVTWADRTLRTAWAYDTEPKFVVPIEDIVYLCNRLQAHAWIVVPVRATTDYIEGLLDYLHDNLDKTAYLEFGNEVFIDPPNPSFYSNYWLRAKGLALGLAVDPYEAQCLAASYYADILFQHATDYLSANSKNRRRFKFCFSYLRNENVMAAAQMNFVRDANPLSDLLDVLSCGGYFNPATDVASMQAIVAACATADDLLDFYQPHVALLLADLAAAAVFVRTFDLEPAIYEWSLFHAVNDPAMLADPSYPAYEALADGMFASPRAALVITYILNRIFEDFAEPVNWFCTPSRRRDLWWPWGIMQDANDPDTGKMDALRGFATTLSGHTWYVRLSDPGLDYGDQANPFQTVARALLHAGNGDLVLFAGDGVGIFDECLNLNWFWELEIDQWDGELEAVLDYASGVGDCATVRKTTGWDEGTISISGVYIECFSASLSSVAVLLGNCNVAGQTVELYSDLDQGDSASALNVYNHQAGTIRTHGMLGYGGNGPVVSCGYQSGGTVDIASRTIACFGLSPAVYLLDQTGGLFKMDDSEIARLGPWFGILVYGHRGGQALFTRINYGQVMSTGIPQMAIYVEDCQAGVVFERVAVQSLDEEDPVTLGAMLIDSSDVVIRNCTLQAGGGSFVSFNCTDNEITNNILVVTAGGPVLSLEDGVNPGHDIDGNCYYSNDFSLYDNGQTYYSYNAWRLKGGERYDGSSIYADPNYYTEYPNMFQLRRNSPCIDAAVIRRNITTTDKAGHVALHINPQTTSGVGGSALDIGAYEYDAFSRSATNTLGAFGRPIYGLRPDSRPVLRGWYLE